MAPRDVLRDSIGEAITADRPVGIRSPKPHPSAHFHTRSDSRNLTESQSLLQTPRIQFGYDPTTTYRFPSTPTVDVPRREKKKPVHVPGWVSVPATLGERGKDRLKAVVVDGILTAISIPFFVLAGVAIQLDGTRVEGNQQNALEQCLKCVSSFNLTTSMRTPH
jgi:hypothetical protein